MEGESDLALQSRTDPNLHSVSVSSGIDGMFILVIRPSSPISHISNCNRNNNWIQSIAFNILMSAEDFFLIPALD